MEATPDSSAQLRMGHQIEEDLLAYTTELEEARASVIRLERAVERGSTALSNGGIALLIASPLPIAAALAIDLNMDVEVSPVGCLISVLYCADYTGVFYALGGILSAGLLVAGLVLATAASRRDQRLRRRLREARREVVRITTRPTSGLGGTVALDVRF
ncbi:MAG TPA: hypothetical protein ENK57_24575 [Polyangiaceae bacterium]|nr:hypothetical protein [Polyangiaceae bacterium]